MMRQTLFTFLATLVLAAWGAAPTSAQVVGRIVDAESEQPVASAGVALYDSTGALVRQALTNAEGRFAFAALDSVDYQLEVTALGYVTSSDYAVTPDQQVFLEITLAPAPLETDGLTIEVEPRNSALERRGFYERQRTAGGGKFLSPEQIQRTVAIDSSDYLARVSGMRVGRDGEPRFLRGSRPCAPNIVVDGVLARAGPLGRDFAFEDIVPVPSSVAAMEIYPSAAVTPIQWRNRDSDCGLIVVWLRTGPSRGAGER